jgi:hypothetical protein
MAFTRARSTNLDEILMRAPIGIRPLRLRGWTAPPIHALFTADLAPQDGSWGKKRQ